MEQINFPIVITGDGYSGEVRSKKYSEHKSGIRGNALSILPYQELNLKYPARDKKNDMIIDEEGLMVVWFPEVDICVLDPSQKNGLIILTKTIDDNDTELSRDFEEHTSTIKSQQRTIHHLTSRLSKLHKEMEIISLNPTEYISKIKKRWNISDNPYTAKPKDEGDQEDGNGDSKT